MVGTLDSMVGERSVEQKFDIFILEHLVSWLYVYRGNTVCRRGIDSIRVCFRLGDGVIEPNVETLVDAAHSVNIAVEKA